MNIKLLLTLALVISACVGLHAELYINEVNSSGKWIEIFNSGDTAVDVGGYTVTRYNNDFTENTATIPSGTTIAANGFLVLYQIGVGSTVEGAIECLPYGISTEKFWSAVLKDTTGQVMDDTFDVGFPQMIIVHEGKSWARKTDGDVDLAALEPTPGRSNTSGPLEPSDVKIYVNEVNSTGKWIEIYNEEDEEVDVGGYTITRFNNDNAIAQNPIPDGTVITAKGFLVLYQGEAVPSPVEDALDCLTFGISSDKFWYVVLKDIQGRLVDNSFNIGNPQTIKVSGGKSWARETDGSVNIVSLEPTPGKPNVSTPETSDLKIFINEVNSTRKWIEIYNDEDADLDIGKYTVTRNNNNGNVAIAYIPEGVTIAAKGFVTLYQGGVVSSPVPDAIDCLPYGISSDRFISAILKDDQGRLVDNTFDIGDPPAVIVNGGKSWARKTDGSDTIVALDPTPGKSNTSGYEMSDLKIYINEVNATGKWVEIYNDEDEDIDVGGFGVIRHNNDDASGITIIPDKTILAAKGFLALYQAGNPSPVKGALNCLAYGISADKFMGIILKDARERLIDTTFNIGNPQTVLVLDDYSWARETDGAQKIVALAPTPGLPNHITSNLVINTDKQAFVRAGTLILPANTSSVQLYTFSGQLVLSRNNSTPSIELKDLPNGIYIVRMTVSGLSHTQKIVLTRY